MVVPGDDQCEMVAIHHPDCECGSCKLEVDVQCLELFVGTVPDSGVRVCGACAVQAELEDFAVAYRSVTRFVVVHPEMGVYLGSAFGLGFWSKLDPCGQPGAVTFPDRERAEEVMATWTNGRPSDARTHPVVPDDVDESRMYATVKACVAAGLEAWDPDSSAVEHPTSKR